MLFDLLTVGADDSPVHALGEAVSPLLPESLNSYCGIVDVLPRCDDGSLFTLDDADFERLFLQPALDLADRMQTLVGSRSRVLLVGSTAHLGDWHQLSSACLMGFSIGLMRSIVLEYMAQGIVINTIALPSGTDQLDSGWAEGTIRMAADLLSVADVNGHIVPCDGGANLRMTKARNRL